MDTLTVSEARSRLSELVARASAGERFLIRRRGRPVAVVLSLREFERLKRSAPAVRRLAEALGQDLEVLDRIDRGELHPAMAAFGLWRDEGADRLEVPAAALAAVAAHAETAYPEECCGILLGRPLAGADGAGEGGAVGCGAAVAQAVAAVNEHAAERRRRYTIGAEAVLRADRAARAEGLAIVGYYHSHPDRPAEPSGFDREHAWPGVSYLIVPVAAGRAGAARSWRLAGDRGGFVEQAVVATGEPRENET